MLQKHPQNYDMVLDTIAKLRKNELAFNICKAHSKQPDKTTRHVALRQLSSFVWRQLCGLDRKDIDEQGRQQSTTIDPRLHARLTVLTMSVVRAHRAKVLYYNISICTADEPH